MTVAHVLTGRDDGPYVVLANSLGTTWEMWDANLAELERHFRVVRFDTRGHGRSPVSVGSPGPCTIDDLADDVIDLLDELGIDRTHFVGLSLGGMTALRVAARNPERIDRLVVLCTGARLDPLSQWTDRAELVRAKGTEAVAEASAQRWYTSAGLAAHRAAAERMVSSIDDEGYAACCEVIATMDLTNDLPKIVARTLAIAGAEDVATPPWQLERIAGSVAHGKLLIVPGAAHLAAAERPDLVTPAVIEHLQRGDR